MNITPAMPLTGEALTTFCKRHEAFETPRWAVEAVLDVEVTTPMVIDPCSGTGIIAKVCEERRMIPIAFDLVDWSEILPHAMKWHKPIIEDWLSGGNALDLSSKTVVMNPPFSLACEFVDKCRALNARKIICFQRQAWRESNDRRAWWDAYAPARVWVCGARASCWRFDLLGTEKAEKSGSPTSYAWYVWERGHKGAELTSAIYPRAT